MAQWTVYYNPMCGKCRDALEFLHLKKIKPTVIEYLKNPPTRDELKAVLAKLDDPASLVRTKEPAFQAKPFNLESVDEIADQLSKNPKLIERPVIIKDDKAIVARPVDLVKVFFD